MPLFVRKFIVDATESAIAVVIALGFAVPHSFDEAKGYAITIAFAVLSASVSAARRAAPDFIAYLKHKLGTAA